MPDLNDYTLPILSEDLDLQFIEDPDFEQMEEGIKRMGQATDLFVLVQGIAILRIEREGLYRQGGFQNLREYRIHQHERLGMPRATVTNRRRMAEAWMTYRKSLAKYDLSGHAQKLVLLDEAVKRHGRREAVQAFWEMSWREFKSYAHPVQIEQELPPVELAIKGGHILLDGEVAFSYSSDVPEEEREFVGNLLRQGYRARKGNLIPHVVAVYDEGEARAVDRYLKELRAKR